MVAKFEQEKGHEFGVKKTQNKKPPHLSNMVAKFEQEKGHEFGVKKTQNKKTPTYNWLKC
jgi:hypothetical protein